MLRPARKSAGRRDYPQYDISAIHEAIVNAVAHRDYSIAGSKIRLFLFADRIDIYSPGALPNTLTIETMAYRVFTRNQLLVNFLSRMTSTRTGHAFLESRGEGVRTILNASEAHAGRRPIYELFGDELRLTIWAKSSPHETDVSATAPLSDAMERHIQFEIIIPDRQGFKHREVCELADHLNANPPWFYASTKGVWSCRRDVLATVTHLALESSLPLSKEKSDQFASQITDLMNRKRHTGSF